jgi:hypothetical protein
VSDEREKAGVGEPEEDVEAHKSTIGKTTVGENDESDENDVEAHKYTVGKTTVGKTTIG